MWREVFPNPQGASKRASRPPELDLDLKDHIFMVGNGNGSNPAPPGMYKALVNKGMFTILPYQLVQDFFHQQYPHELVLLLVQLWNDMLWQVKLDPFLQDWVKYGEITRSAGSTGPKSFCHFAFSSCQTWESWDLPFFWCIKMFLQLD